ncbi:MAG: dual OB domain-containing protein [Ktedonobacterales bacterium]
MEIVVTHLTRMQSGYICVAGIETATGKHIRPVVQGRLTNSLLVRYGGSFDMAAVIQLGPVTYAGQPPEVEDYRFTPVSARHLHTATPAAFWPLLKRAAMPSLARIFGDGMTAHGPGCVVAKGKGIASLGCLIPASRPHLYVNDAGKIRMTLTDGQFHANLSVSDLRLYEPDQQTPARATVAAIAQRILSGVDVLLSVGLGRPYRAANDEVERHWLQVNNIHLADDPAWQLD